MEPSDRAIGNSEWNVPGGSKSLSKLILGDYKKFRNTKFLLAQRKVIILVQKRIWFYIACAHTGEAWQLMANTLRSISWVYSNWGGGCLGAGEHDTLLKSGKGWYYLSWPFKCSFPSCLGQNKRLIFSRLTKIHPSVTDSLCSFMFSCLGLKISKSISDNLSSSFFRSVLSWHFSFQPNKTYAIVSPTEISFPLNFQPCSLHCCLGTTSITLENLIIGTDHSVKKSNWNISSTMDNSYSLWN